MALTLYFDIANVAFGKYFTLGYMYKSGNSPANCAVQLIAASPLPPFYYRKLRYIDNDVPYSVFNEINRR